MSLTMLMLARKYADRLFADGLTATIVFTDGAAQTHTITIVSGLITAWEIV